MGTGEPSIKDVLTDKPLAEALLTRTLPEIIAGRYRLDVQRFRELHMMSVIEQTLKESETVLAVVGYTHAAVLGRYFEQEDIPVEVFQMMHGLVLDESLT